MDGKGITAEERKQAWMAGNDRLAEEAARTTWAIPTTL